jgi:hypothetical protein
LVVAVAQLLLATILFCRELELQRKPLLVAALALVQMEELAALVALAVAVGNNLALGVREHRVKEIMAAMVDLTATAVRKAAAVAAQVPLVLVFRVQ